MAILTRTEAVTVPDGSFSAHVALPPSGSGPGILLLQEIFGVNDYLTAVADRLAELGYVVLAPEIYWRLGGSVDESRPDFMDQAVGLLQQVDWDVAVSDAVAALDSLRARPEISGGVGVMGFCFGGGLAFNVAAVADVDVLVAYYGSALPELLHLADRVTTPSLHHFGTADTYIPLEKVEEIRSAVEGPEVEFYLHEGAGHAFDNPHPMFLHEPARLDAWRRTTEFLHRRLPVE